MFEENVDERYMRRALELAERGVGWCSPNPPVGAVLVRQGVVIGEGWHALAGGPHAEVAALRDALSRHRAADLRGAHLYVTLEPCNHDGRTPPCTRAILEAGIGAVIVGTGDPNPRVAGGGAAFLRSSGVTVHTGMCESEARHLIRMFAHHTTAGRPFVVAKFGASLDGKTATSAGASQWITGSESRREVHALRHAVDAVLVGVGTVIADNPALTARRDEASRSPTPVVIDSSGRIPQTCRLVAHAVEQGLIVATTSKMPVATENALIASGVEIWRLPADDRGRVQLAPLLDQLGESGVQSVLVEGGGTVHGSFFDDDLVDEVWAFLAPSIIGGASAPTAVAGLGSSTLDHAARFHRTAVDIVGEDVLIRLGRRTN